MNERMLQRWNPFTPTLESPLAMLRRATADMERFFDGLSEAPLMKRGSRAIGELHWTPNVDVIEKDNTLTIRVDLPGLARDEVKVDVTADAITVRGERKREVEEERDGQYRLERAYGSFLRAVPLPEGVKAEDVKATFKNGVLEVTAPVPAAQSKEPKVYQVNIDAPADEKKAKASAA
jgi:HSP20 family protein